jgi:hypothetical protein
MNYPYARIRFLVQSCLNPINITFDGKNLLEYHLSLYKLCQANLEFLLTGR